MAATSTNLTQIQRDYLATQPLGRLATVDADGAPQNNPVSYRVNDDGSIDIGGYGMGTSRKYRNVAGNNRVAFVVDDVLEEPRTIRFVEIRGVAEQIPDGTPPHPGQESRFIRIRPQQIFSYGLGEDAT